MSLGVNNHQGGGCTAACVAEHWPDVRVGRVNLKITLNNLPTWFD